MENEIAAITRRLELIEAAICALAIATKTVGPLAAQAKSLHDGLQAKEPLQPELDGSSLVHLLHGLVEEGLGV